MNKKKKLRNKVIGGAVVVTVATTPILYTTNKINKLKEENTKLQDKIELNENIENVEVEDTTFEELKEINEKNVKLIVYEAEAKGFSKTISDESLIESTVTVNTSYTYAMTLDLSTTKIIHTEGKYIVIVDLSKIKLDNINIAPMDIQHDLNFFNRWKGKTQAELTSTIIAMASDNIETHVKKDVEYNMGLIQARAKSKVYSLYNGLPIEVIFTGEI